MNPRKDQEEARLAPASGAAFSAGDRGRCRGGPNNLEREVPKEFDPGRVEIGAGTLQVREAAAQKSVRLTSWRASPGATAEVPILVQVAGVVGELIGPPEVASEAVQARLGVGRGVRDNRAAPDGKG